METYRRAKESTGWVTIKLDEERIKAAEQLFGRAGLVFISLFIVVTFFFLAGLIPTETIENIKNLNVPQTCSVALVSLIAALFLSRRNQPHEPPKQEEQTGK